jgi:hypothetical protein
MNACSQRSLSGATKNDLAGVKGTASSCALEKVGMDLVRLRSLGVSNQDDRVCVEGSDVRDKSVDSVERVVCT